VGRGGKASRAQTLGREEENRGSLLRSRYPITKLDVPGLSGIRTHEHTWSGRCTGKIQTTQSDNVDDV
jgi:hypothetical protein